MSDLGFNKIAGCVLATGLAVIGLNEASHAFFPHTEHAKDGYRIDVPEAPEGGATPVIEGPRDYFKLISAANLENGKSVAAKCLQCHKFEPGAEALQGPPLFGVVGRDIASLDFKYSAGPGSIGEKEGVWDYANLDRLMESPKKYAPATAMNFIGLKKQTDRADIMAYLRTLTTGEPLPLPAPLPEQPAAPVEGAAPATLGPGAPASAGATPAQPAPAQH